MKIKDQKEHVTLLVQCKCIGAVTQIGIMGFSHPVRCQVCRNTHTFSNMPTLCAIHSAKNGSKTSRERKIEGNFLLAKTWFNSTHNSSQIPTHNIDSFQK